MTIRQQLQSPSSSQVERTMQMGKQKEQKSGQGAETPKPRDARWTEIYKQLQEDNVQFFLNTELEPTVRIPTDGFRTEWPVDSQRFQDLLVSMFYEISEEILKSTDRDFLTAQIREECRKGGRELTEPEAAKTDEDVIVQTVVTLMNRVETFSGLTGLLSKELKKIQDANFLSSSEGIPAFTNIFSRKLNRRIPVLRGYGVDVVVEHKESGSHCTLKRMDSFQNEPLPEEIVPDGSTNQSSAKSSGATPKTGAGLPPTDDADGEYRADPPKMTSRTSDPKNNASSKKGGAK